MKQFALAIASMALRSMMKAASPVIREFIVDKISEIQKKAEETPNKFDDILADALHDIIIGD